jgi:hypothetical protein
MVVESLREVVVDGGLFALFRLTSALVTCFDALWPSPVGSSIMRNKVEMNPIVLKTDGALWYYLT